MNRLKIFRERAGLSQLALADLANTSGVQIGRLEKASRKLTVEWADRLAPHLNCRAIDLLYELSEVNISGVMVVGAVQAGQWNESAEWPQDSHYVVKIVDDRYSQTIGLEVRGDSMNKIYPEGTVLICRNFDAMNELPPVGKRVIVRRRNENSLTESTVKLLIVDDEGRGVLVPESTNPIYGPIPFKPSGDGDNDTEIAAVVVGAYIKE